MQNQDQNAEFLAQQHMYAREKEKADKMLARYDFIMKLSLAFVASVIGMPILLMFAVGVTLPAIITLIVGGGILFVIYRTIKGRREAHQAKLDLSWIHSL